MARLLCGYGLVSPAQVKQFAQAVCDVLGRAAYWKKYYNTSSGKGSVEEYIARVKPFQVYF